MSLFKSIIMLFLSAQEKFLIRNLSNTIGVKNKSKRKKYYGHGYLLTLDSLAETEKNKFEEEMTLLLKNFDYNPEKILEYIKKQGTDVYYTDKTSLLCLAGENSGFIYPQKGIKALFLSLFLSKKFALKTNEMFILTNGEINKYFFIYYFYNWYMFKHGVEGIDAEGQQLLKKYLFDNSQENIKKLQLNEIYKLKDAIKQDKAAINFVIKLCQQYEGTKNALEKLKNDGANL